MKKNTKAKIRLNSHQIKAEKACTVAKSNQKNEAKEQRKCFLYRTASHKEQRKAKAPKRNTLQPKLKTKTIYTQDE